MVGWLSQIWSTGFLYLFSGFFQWHLVFPSSALIHLQPVQYVCLSNPMLCSETLISFFVLPSQYLLCSALLSWHDLLAFLVFSTTDPPAPASSLSHFSLWQQIHDKVKRKSLFGLKASDFLDHAGCYQCYQFYVKATHHGKNTYWSNSDTVMDK